ncbi:MAG: hypothetical protein ACM3Q4_05710 [Acidobacteriota bacterium]
MGRSALIMVMGFSLLYFIHAQNYYSVNVDAFRNAMAYYDSTAIHEIAVAGANLACTEIYRAPNWRTGFSNIAYNGGTFTVTAANISGTQRVQIVSTATLGGRHYSVVVVIQPSVFCKFAYWGTGSSGGGGTVRWETGDTITGPMHTNGLLRTTGAPTFQGKTTSKNGIDSINVSPRGPQFNAPFDWGYDIPLNASSLGKLDSIAMAGGKRLQSTADSSLYLKFNANGTVTFKHRFTGPETTKTLAQFAPNGVISIDKGNLYVQGTVNGQVTILANKSSGSRGGTVYITGDLTYATDPRSDTSQHSMLGIVAHNDVIVRNNNAASFTVMGSIYSANTGLEVEDLDTRQAGTLTLVGGLIAPVLNATSNGRTGWQRRGYNLSIQYDERFMNGSPPYFPTTGSYEILSWYE